jgi:hypothetical protein
MTHSKDGPPQTERNGPVHGRAASKINHRQAADAVQCIAGLRRRRAAARRLPVLDSGRSDPWSYDRSRPSDKTVDAYQEAALHIFDAGMCPAAFMPEMRALWRRGGEDQRLVRDISERWPVTA